MNLLIFGLQRSGTNFLESIVKTNFHVHFLNSNDSRSVPIQKHFRFYKDKKCIPTPEYLNQLEVNSFHAFEALFTPKPDFYLIISKDPIRWYPSYKKWAIKCGWPSVSHNYIQEYNLFYGFFIQLSHQTNNFIFVRHCDLVSDTRGTIKNIESQIGLERKLFSKIFFRIPKRVPQSERFCRKTKDDYLKSDPVKNITSQEFEIIKAKVDLQVLTFLGYHI